MRSLNKTTIIGVLGRDPELKSMPNGNSVVNISVATDEGYKDRQSGNWVEKTEWHSITAYGKLAEIIAQYLKKGSRAYFEGKNKTQEWEKDGIKRSKTVVEVYDMMMLDNRSANDAGFAPQSMGTTSELQSGAFSQNSGPGFSGGAFPTNTGFENSDPFVDNR